MKRDAKSELDEVLCSS